MSTTVAIARNTAIQMVGKITSTLLGLAAVALMTRELGVEQFGWYVTASGFLQFIGIFSDFGFTVTTAKLLSEPAFDKTKLFQTIFTWRLITAIIFQGLAPLLILFFPYPAPVKIAVAITTVSFLAFAVNQVLIGYYQVHLKMHLQAIGEVLGRLVLVAGIAWCALTDAGFLAMMIVITAAAIVYSLYLLLNFGPISFSLDRTLSRALFSTMWPTALAVLFNSFYLQGDRVILPLFVSQEAVGLYGASYRVIEIVTQFTVIITGIMLPLITAAWSRAKPQEFTKYAQLSLELMALVIFPIIAGVFVLHTPLMVLVAGAKFAAAGPILQALIISVLCICFGMTFGHIALAVGRQRQALWIYASDALLSIAGYFIFIPRFGVWGAIGVTIFSELYAGVLLTALVMRSTGFTPRLATVFKITLCSLAMGMIITRLPALPAALSIVAGAVIYAVLILALRVISWPAIREVLRTKPVAIAE